MSRPLTLEALQEQTQRIFPGNKFTMYFFDTEVSIYTMHGITCMLHVCGEHHVHAVCPSYCYVLYCSTCVLVAKRLQASVLSRRR